VIRIQIPGFNRRSRWRAAQDTSATAQCEELEVAITNREPLIPESRTTYLSSDLKRSITRPDAPRADPGLDRVGTEGLGFSRYHDIRDVVVGVELDEKSSTGGDIPVGGMAMESTGSIDDRLGRIEALLGVLVERQTVKEHYTPEEFARLVGCEPFTCREYCRLGRIRAEKKASGRGKHASWVISHDELLPFQRDGLLPDRRRQPKTANMA
jgi:hypothetical protein